MSKLSAIAAALACTILLAACGGAKGLPDPPAGHVVAPQARPAGEPTAPAGEAPAAGQPAAASQAPAAASQAPTPRLTLAQGERLLDLVDTNLDLDAPDEQILVVQSGEGQPIRLLVADYDEIRQAWRRAADYTTLATNARSFRVEAEDIVGDYTLEIVAQGLTADSQTTLDVLRRVPAQSGTGISFTPIIRLSADHSITIDRHRRPQSYQFGQKYDESFPIIVERRDPKSDNQLDTVRETWRWRNPERKYTKTLEERIPGAQLAQKQLEQLFSPTATENDYRQFLAGPWYRKNDVKNVLMFDERTMSFSDGDVQEIYQVDFFARSGNVVRLDTHNAALQQIKKWITLVIASSSTLRVDVRNASWIAEDDPWSGEYERLTPDLQQSVLAAMKRAPASPPARLVGIFRSSDGAEIAFDAPSFTWITADGKSSSGGFAVMEALPLLNAHYLERDVPARVNVMSFKFLEEAGLKSTDKSYLLEYKEKADASAVVRTIALTPVSLTVRGAVATSHDPAVFEQIEMKGDSPR
jgi:hypothetical protein